MWHAPLAPRACIVMILALESQYLCGKVVSMYNKYELLQYRLEDAKG